MKIYIVNLNINGKSQMFAYSSLKKMIVSIKGFYWDSINIQIDTMR